MTSAELRDAALLELKATTIAYPEWHKRVTFGYKGKPYDGAQTGWGRAFSFLARIDPSHEIAVGGNLEFATMLADIADWSSAAFSWQEVSETEVVIRLRRQG